MTKHAIFYVKGVFYICIMSAFLLIGIEGVHASVIPDVTASSSMLSSANTNVMNIVNGSGLPGNTPSLTGIHTFPNAGNVWSSGYKTGSVIFNLHGQYRVVGVSVWPFNGNNTVCARQVQWLASNNGTTYTPISGMPAELPQGPWANQVAPVYYSIPNITATHLRLDIYSNYGHYSYSGLAEIQFDGVSTDTPDVDPPLPNPLTWAIIPTATKMTEISMTSTTAIDENGVEYYFANITDPTHDSGWVNDPQWTDKGLSPNTLYEYQVKARDRSPQNNQTDWSTTSSVVTLRFECEVYPPADLNLDGRVDFLELEEVMYNWGVEGESIADLNDDGIVDLQDLLRLAEGWLDCGRIPIETCWE